MIAVYDRKSFTYLIDNAELEIIVAKGASAVLSRAGQYADSGRATYENERLATQVAKLNELLEKRGRLEYVKREL